MGICKSNVIGMWTRIERGWIEVGLGLGDANRDEGHFTQQPDAALESGGSCHTASNMSPWEHG